MKSQSTSNSDSDGNSTTCIETTPKQPGPVAAILLQTTLHSYPSECCSRQECGHLPTAFRRKSVAAGREECLRQG